MKLPRLEDKFVISNETSRFYGNVVSGVHLDVRADEDNPDRLWYYVRVDRAYEGDVVSLYGGFVSASLTLEGAFEYVAHYFTPYQEQEEKPGEEPAPGTVDSSEEGSVVEKENSDGQESSDRRGRSEGDSRVQEETGLLVTAGHDCRKYAGRRHTPIGTAKDTFGVTAVAAANHMSDSFNSLAADLLHLQHVLTPALSGAGGAAYA